MLEIDVQTLRELLAYDAETGVLTWLERPRRYFSADHFCQQWNKRFAGQEAFTVGDKGYRRGMVFRRMYLSHRVAWALHYGEWPTQMLDHINGNRADNRIANLREVSRSENSRNSKRRRTNTSGVNGVARFGKKWRAYITIHLGVFDTIEEATAARRAAEAEHGYHPNHGLDESTRESGEPNKTPLSISQ